MWLSIDSSQPFMALSSSRICCIKSTISRWFGSETIGMPCITGLELGFCSFISPHLIFARSARMAFVFASSPASNSSCSIGWLILGNGILTSAACSRVASIICLTKSVCSRCQSSIDHLRASGVLPLSNHSLSNSSAVFIFVWLGYLCA